MATTRSAESTWPICSCTCSGIGCAFITRAKQSPSAEYAPMRDVRSVHRALHRVPYPGETRRAAFEIRCLPRAETSPLERSLDKHAERLPMPIAPKVAPMVPGESYPLD